MRLRRFLAPKWVLGHLLVLAAAITMIFLGRWQLDVSNSKHFSLQNFGYAIQWWAFSAFTVLMWGKILRDIARHDAQIQALDGQAPPPPVEVARNYRHYVMPQSSTAPEVAGDSEQAAYNAYLARLAEGDR